MDFSKALQVLKAGGAVTRRGWNGKGMFAYLVPAATYKAVTDIAKNLIGDEVPYRAYLALKTVDGTVACWTPSTSDILADDWEVVA